MKFAIALVLALAACPPKPTPPPDMAVPPDMGGTGIACAPRTARPVTEDNCGSFTVFGTEIPAGLACFQCGPRAQGCLDEDDVVYCVKTNCTSDPYCRPDPNAMPAFRPAKKLLR